MNKLKPRTHIFYISLLGLLMLQPTQPLWGYEKDNNPKVVKKWIALGNSITKHAITPFWWGEWGMAATVKEKDYVHLLNSLLEDYYKTTLSFKAVNIATWERDFNGFDKESIRSHFSGDEDIVVIRLGENVPNREESYAVYKEEFSHLVAFLKVLAPTASFVITGNFWANARKDAIQKEVADQYNCIWVPLAQLETPENKSTLETKVSGDDGEWHTVSEGGKTAPGVANHPGDEGMKNIATAIMNAIKGNPDYNACIEDILKTHTLKIRYEASQILYPAVKDKNSYLYGIPKETLTYYFNMITNNPMEIEDDKKNLYNMEPKEMVKLERLSDKEKDKYISQLTHTPEDFLEEYKALIQHIKSNKIYLECINAELEKSDASEYSKGSIGYNFLHPMSSGPLPLMMTKLDYLKLFKEFIFNDDKEVLPDSLEAYIYIHCNCKK